jgi:hypothetical protein
MSININFEQAKAIASEEAPKGLAEGTRLPVALLEDFYIEERNCWMFFRSREIAYPSEAAAAWAWCYVVSNRGECRLFQDLYNDIPEAKIRLKIMADFFDRTEL